MEKIILRSDNFDGEIVLEYDFNGCLTKYENLADMNEVQLKYFFENFPLNGVKFNWLADNTKLKIERIPADLSFEKLWNLYDYKMGKKDKTIVLWSKMAIFEKILCIQSLKYYDKYRTRKRGLDKQYLETYLRNKQWEVDWKGEEKKL